MRSCILRRLIIDPYYPDHDPKFIIQCPSWSLEFYTRDEKLKLSAHFGQRWYLEVDWRFHQYWPICKDGDPISIEPAFEKREKAIKWKPSIDLEGKKHCHIFCMFCNQEMSNKIYFCLLTKFVYFLFLL